MCICIAFPLFNMPLTEHMFMSIHLVCFFLPWRFLALIAVRSVFIHIQGTMAFISFPAPVPQRIGWMENCGFSNLYGLGIQPDSYVGETQAGFKEGQALIPCDPCHFGLFLKCLNKGFYEPIGFWRSVWLSIYASSLRGFQMVFFPPTFAPKWEHFSLKRPDDIVLIFSIAVLYPYNFPFKLDLEAAHFTSFQYCM